MRRVLLLLCAVAFSLSSARLFAQEGDGDKGSGGNEALRQSIASGGSFPGGPIGKAPLSTGYYIVDNDAPAVGSPWSPTFQFLDTTGAEGKYWRRIISGPNQRPASFWSDTGSQGLEYFRNPNKLQPGPNGTVITDSTDDAFAGPISIGFPFFYYGRKYDSFYVSTNGLVALTNRRYQYNELGVRVDYEPVHDGYAVRPKLADPLADPTPDDYGYQYVALGKGTAWEGKPDAGILSGFNGPFPTSPRSTPYSGTITAPQLSVLAPLWDDCELSQYDYTAFRPDDYGKVYWRRDLANNKLIIYYVQMSMASKKDAIYGGQTVVKGIPLIKAFRQVRARDLAVNFQVVLDRTDSTVQFNYARFIGQYTDPISNVITVPTNTMFRVNATIGIQSHDQEFTNYMHDADQPGGQSEAAGKLYTNGSTATPHDKLAIRFKQWRNVVRVNKVTFQIPSQYTPGLFVDLPPGQLVDNYELLLGNSILGVIRPVGIVQNVSDSIGPVNVIKQPIRFNVIFRIRDLINTTFPPIYQRTASTDSLGPIRLVGAPGAKKNVDTIVFDPYVTNAAITRQVGRFKAEVIATDQAPNGSTYGQEWPFDDTTGVRLFGIRRIEAPFIDNFNEYDYSPEDGIIPSVKNWVSIGAQVVDGESQTYNPPPPRGVYGSRGLNSPVCLLDRKDNFQNFYFNDDAMLKYLPNNNVVIGGDTIISFPINLSQFVSRPVLVLSYERAGKIGGIDPSYKRNWSDNQRIGPEQAVYTTSKDGLFQFPDMMLVEFANPSPNGLDGIVNLYNFSSWRDPSFVDNRTGSILKWSNMNSNNSGSAPRWGVFGGGGGSGLDTTGRITADEFDAGKDFEFYRAYIPIPAKWSKVAPGNKTFRFRIRVDARSNRNPVGSPADDEDKFYVDNVMVIEPAKPEVEVTAVRVDWPYTEAPASQARSIPLSVKIGNNGSTAATTFGVAMWVEKNPSTLPPGMVNYYRYKAIISIPAGRDYVESFPPWNAQECGTNIIPDTNNPVTSTDYRIWARILPANYDSFTPNDMTYTDFKLRLGPTFAYDDGTNDVQSYAGLQGKGLNLVPPTNQDGAFQYPFGPIGGSSSGTFAMQFRILTRDTIRGFQAYFAGANQAQDFILYSIYQQPAFTNVNNPPAGQPVASTLAYARRGEGVPTTPNPGHLFNFDQYVTYMLDTPFVAEPGIYFATVAQLGETGLELGADESRMGQVTTIANPPPPAGSGGPTGGIGNYSIPAHPEMRQNRFWYETTTGSGGWSPMITQVNNPGYPHLTWDGQNPPAIPISTYARGSWIPMIRPYFGIKGSTECAVEPVELADFRLTTLPSALRLDWTTATEINNHGFYIERRIKGAESQWSELGFQAGAGTSNQPHQYSRVDNDVVVNTTYQYRLRQEDRDGSVTYSGIKEGRISGGAIAGASNELAQNSPNPFSNSTRIAFSVVETGKVRLEINDVYGNVVRSFDVDAQAGAKSEVVWDGLDANGIKVPNGAYIYKLVGDGFTLTNKLTVAR